MTKQDDNSTISQAELARRLGLSRGRISQYRGMGMPILEDGKVNLADALDWIAKNVDPTRRKSEGEADLDAIVNGDLNAVRTQHERVKLARATKALEREQGITVYKSDVETALFARARMERGAHENFVIRTAPLLAAEFNVDERGMFAALEKHMRQHLEALANTPLDLTDDPARNTSLG